MKRNISFSEEDLHTTIARIDFKIDHLFEHNLPLIYEVLLKNESSFGKEIFEDMLKEFNDINDELDKFDRKHRAYINIKTVTDVIDKFKRDREHDSY